MGWLDQYDSAKERVTNIKLQALHDKINALQTEIYEKAKDKRPQSNDRIRAETEVGVLAVVKYWIKEMTKESEE